METSKIEKLIAVGCIDEALVAIGNSDTAEAHYLLGRIAWKQGKRSVAISEYEHSAAIAPDGPGAVALEQVREVMDFFNHDLYNP